MQMIIIFVEKKKSKSLSAEQRDQSQGTIGLFLEAKSLLWQQQQKKTTCGCNLHKYIIIMQKIVINNTFV